MTNPSLCHALPTALSRTRRIVTGGVCVPLLAAGLTIGLGVTSPAVASAAATTTGHDPAGHLKEATRSGRHGLGHSVRAAGFSRDPDSDRAVRVTISVDHKPVKRISADKVRSATGNHTAFTTRVHVGSGKHRVCAYAHNVGPGTGQRIGCFTVPARWKIRNTAIADLAARYVGSRYVSGGASPRGFDCSGYTSYVYRKAARLHLAHSAQTQSSHAHRISRSDLRIGDLVFFHSGSYVYHVAIYAGHGDIWAAATSRDGVLHQRIWSSAVSYGSYTHH